MTLTPRVARSLVVRHGSAGGSAGRANARWITAALWLSFFGLPIRSLFADVNAIRHFGRFLPDLTATIFIILGIRRLVARHSKRALPRVILALLVLSISSAATGIVLGNGQIEWVLGGLFPFGSLLVFFAVEPSELEEPLERALFWQLCLGELFAAYAIFFVPVGSRLDWNGVAGDGVAKYAARAVTGAWFLLGTIGTRTRWRDLVVLLGLGEYVSLAVIGASRGMMVVSGLILPVLLVVLSFRRREFAMGLRRQGLVVGACAGVLAMAIATPYGQQHLEYLGRRWESAIVRLSGAGPDEDRSAEDFSTGVLDVSRDEYLGDRGRGGELRDFFGQLDARDLIIGRGFGGKWVSRFWGIEWRIVHVGFAFLILVGGIPLSVSFLLLFVAIFRLTLRDMKESAVAAGCFCYMAVFAENFLQHGAMQDEFEVSIFWICVSLAYKGVGAAARRPARSASIQPRTALKRRPLAGEA